MHAKDLLTAADVGQRHHHLAVKASRTHQGRIEHIGPVRRRNHDDIGAGLKTVHFNEHLVERLLALVIAAAKACASLAAHGIDFVNEDDAGSALLGVLKHIAHTRRANAHEHLDKVRAGNGEEGHASLARDRLCEQRLAGARRPDQEDAARNVAAKPLELGRIPQKVDNFLHLFLGFITPGHIGKAHLVRAVVEHSCLALAKGERAALAALHLAHEEHPHANEQEHREPAHENGLQERGLLFGLAEHLPVILSEVINHPEIPGARDRIL